MLTPRILSIVVTLPLLAFTVTASAQTAEPRAAIARALGKLPLHFVENRGVYPDEVMYYIQGADKTLFFADDGVTFALRGEERGWTVKLDFVGANPDARPEGREKQRAVISYFTGPEKDWQAGLPTFAEIVYRDLWPGIDLVYRGTVNELKYEFVVAPGADPQQIRLRYRGASSVTTTVRGALQVETPGGSFEDAPPVAWQEVDGECAPVDVAYALDESGQFGFRIGDYDGSRPLILDPAVLVYCGYIGGSGDDFVQGSCAVDAAGYLYVAGTTNSAQATFPVKVGPDLTYNGGTSGLAGDCFVAKVDAQGRLVYCGYIGGAGPEGTLAAVAVDAAGNAYVAGRTNSDESTFPVTVGPDLTFNAGNSDAFVAKVNAQGTALVYCGYIGGGGNDKALAVAVDQAGNAYVAGGTTSTQSTFPVKAGPDLTYNDNGLLGDGFVAKVNPRGTGLLYCGYIGGSATDVAHDVALDAAGSLFVSGRTKSSQTTFPVKVGPDLTFNGGRWDAFVAKVNAQGTSLTYCGYIGGSGDDEAWGITADPGGNAYVCGLTESSQGSFPVKVGPDLTFNGGVASPPQDGFVAKVNVLGTALVFCGYIGGAGDESANGIALDATGSVYLAGTTSSDERSFPITVGPDLTFNGVSDSFVAKLNAQGTTYVYCGYIGGSSSEGAATVVVDQAGNAYVCGHTKSDENTFPVKSGPGSTYRGGFGDAFVAKVALTLLQGAGNPRPGNRMTLTLTATEDAGLGYELGSSLGIGPIQIGSRKLALSPDDLLVVSVNGWWASIFSGYQGVIGTNGQANASINIPNWSVLVGNTIHTAFVTLSPSAPQGIKSISNTFSFQIQ